MGEFVGEGLRGKKPVHGTDVCFISALAAGDLGSIAKWMVWSLTSRYMLMNICMLLCLL